MTTWADFFSTTPDLARVMSDHELVRRMLDFEAALAQALAQAGLASATQAAAIVSTCRSVPVDFDTLFAEGAKAGTLAIPLVKLLNQRTRERDPSAAAWVHYGATSQDVVDSAMVLQTRQALALIDQDLAALGDAVSRLAGAHRNTPTLGRTLLQPATPIPFGIKAAQWLAAIGDARRRLARDAADALQIQFGGAAGALSSLGDKATVVASALNALLAPPKGGPKAPALALPWHSRRGNLVALAASLGIVVGACAKMARDIALLMQFEVSEASEPAAEGRGGSSAMPHKRNPVLCMFTVAAAVRSPHLVATMMSGLTQEHERALGGWQAEWAVFPELVKLVGGAVANMREAAQGLVVDVRRMRANLDALRGLPMTETASLHLARVLGREDAARAVEDAARRVVSEGLSLNRALADDPRIAKSLSREEIDQLASSENLEGASQAFIDLALAEWETIKSALQKG